jgi:aminoglycoside/choline kinase family phosphotransferase
MSVPTPFDVKAFFAARVDARHFFLKSNIAGDFTIEPIGEDWASRHYLRIRKSNGSTLVLLESVPDHIPTATMGHKISAYIKITNYLRSHKIHVPEIYAASPEEGWILIEDFGSVTLYDALETTDDKFDLYASATNELIRMRDDIPSNDIGLPDFMGGYIYNRRRRIIDWYHPATKGEKNPDGMVESYLDVWSQIENSLPPCPMGFIHGDFHAQNLMRLPDGVCGILDFQDSYWGPRPFDLANLIEDIRRDIPKDVHAAILDKYGADETFRAWFRVMATQFHCSIIGQVLRLAIIGGKPHMLKFIPRMQNYIREGLKNPVLQPLSQWFEEHQIDLSVQHFNPDEIRAFIRDDAF